MSKMGVFQCLNLELQILSRNYEIEYLEMSQKTKNYKLNFKTETLENLQILTLRI